ncbi:efflux RND transporter periplasmic adaptor subunit [Bacteroidia bacterium]|nr:efflux RND transporter periplasmic adaptor subunit [Bacteroidia bacterium]
MRKTILSIIGSVLIIALSFLLYKKMASSKKAPKKNTEKSLQSVVVKKVVNSSLPIEIKSTGSILAKNRAVLYSEVQGVFQATSTLFKAGVRYNKGQVLILINQAEFGASVKSQRIAFKSLITSLLADIQFDYPNELQTWKNYEASISANRNLPQLPKVIDTKLANYLSVKNVNSTYYTIKNLETRLNKYTITAPFSGVLVETNVTPGSLVSPGQKLGEFIQPGVYELELNVNASLKDFLKVGRKVTLWNTDHTSNYTGTLTRINAQVDRASQTVQVFVQVNSSQLNEGEYLEAQIEAEQVEGVTEIERNLVIDQDYVFIVENNRLKKVQISTIHSNENTLIVKGLKDNTELIALPVPGGYDGMKITIRK